MGLSNNTEQNVTPTEIPVDIIQFSITERALLTIFCFIMTFLGFLGNGTVLYSSIRYNAIRLDRVSVLLIQNLGVADILYTLFVILPQLITTVAGRWVLGSIYCFISAQLSFIPASLNSLTVLLITAYRLWLVKHPFSTASTSRMKIALLITWVMSSAGSIISLSYKSSSTFKPEYGKCSSGVYDNSAAIAIFNVALTLVGIIPLFLIVILNAVLCFIAWKSSRRAQGRTKRRAQGRKKEISQGGQGTKQERSQANYKALVMVCALSGLFILSWVPFITFTLLKSRNPDVPPKMELLALLCFFLNASGNPILYTMTNKRFGSFVKALLYRAFCGQRGEVKVFKEQSKVKKTSITYALSGTECGEKEEIGGVKIDRRRGNSGVTDL